jgi:cytochrome oxidase Cu insertion factor (SCO1/SenC/PrrC family)
MEHSGTGRSRRTVIRGGVGALLAALAGCTGSSGTADTATTGGAPTDTDAAGVTTSTPSVVDDWRAVELTDVRSGEAFTVGGFGGSPVLVEFFAVWCPVCTSQQREVGTLVERRNDLVAVSLNVDPNEDADQVREHAEKEGFDWRYAVAPPAMTKALIDEFGAVVTNAPAAPVVRICSDRTATLVDGRGLKSADALEVAFDGC